MQSSNNYFELTTWFKKNIDWLNHVILGGESESVLIDGVLKPTISKDIKERVTEISTGLRDGVISFRLKSDLDAYTPTSTQQKSSFKVTSDPLISNNGYYSWNGGGYIKDASLISDLVSETATDEAISSAAIWREAGKLLGHGFYPIQPKAAPHPTSNPNVDFRGAIVDADFRPVNEAGHYDPNKYYSFAEISGGDEGYSFKLYASPDAAGGGWELVFTLHSNDAINLPEGGYDPNSNEVLHLKKAYNDSYCYLSFIPSKLPHDGYHGSISWDRGGLMPEVFTEDPTERSGIPRRLRALLSEIVSENDHDHAPSSAAVFEAIKKSVTVNVFQPNAKATPARDWKPILVGLDFSELHEFGGGVYSSHQTEQGDPLYFSFAEVSFTDSGFSLRLYASVNTYGSGWISLPFTIAFNPSHLIAGQTYSRTTTKKLHLKHPFIGTDGETHYVYATIRPGMFTETDGYIGSVTWDEAGLNDDVWSDGESLYDYKSIFAASDGSNKSVSAKAISPIVFTGNYYATEIRDAFVECQLTGTRKENSTYGPRYIRIDDAGIYMEFYQWDKTLNDGKGGWVTTGNPSGLSIPRGSMEIDEWFYYEMQGAEWGFKLLLNPSKFPKSMFTSSNYEIYFDNDCWNPDQSFVINQRNSGSSNSGIKPRLCLPKTLYAMEGFDFRLYYDSIALLPDVGVGDFPGLIDVNCIIGKMDRRCFFVNPTASQVGDHSITITIYNSDGVVLDSVSSTIKVLPKSNPGKATKLVSIGDSTTDDKGIVTREMQVNLASIGGNVPEFVGSRGYKPGCHEARTGKTFSYFVNGQRGYKFNVTGIENPDAYWYPLWSYYGPDGTGYILMNQEWGIQPDGTGYIIADIWSWPDSGALPEGWSGVLQKRGGSGPDTITVTSLEYVEGFSPFRDYAGGGGLDFQYYADKHGYGTIDVLATDLGINDMRGRLRSKGEVDAVVEQAKTLVDAFHAYNPAGWVVIGLPKSPCSTLFKASISTYRMNIHLLRERLISAFDNGKHHPQVILCPAGMMIDRYYAYSLSVKGSSKHYPDATVVQHGDDVHPRTEGHFEMAESRVPALSYALSKV